MAIYFSPSEWKKDSAANPTVPIPALFPIPEVPNNEPAILIF
jgi:hypothetical protein